MTFNLKQKIINFAHGLLKYLAKKKKLCPTGPASCPANIKLGLTNALMREKILCRLETSIGPKAEGRSATCRSFYYSSFAGQALCQAPY